MPTIEKLRFERVRRETIEHLVEAVNETGEPFDYVKAEFFLREFQERMAKELGRVRIASGVVVSSSLR